MCDRSNDPRLRENTASNILHRAVVSPATHNMTGSGDRRDGGAGLRYP